MNLNRLVLAIAVAALPAVAVADPATAQTLERIKESNTLRIGHRADAWPFSYVDEAGILELGDSHMTYEPYALALARGDEDFRLAVDRELSRIYGSKETRGIYTRYFGRPNETTSIMLLLSSLSE